MRLHPNIQHKKLWRLILLKIFVVLRVNYLWIKKGSNFFHLLGIE